jgi:hypothetical protein
MKMYDKQLQTRIYFIEEFLSVSDYDKQTRKLVMIIRRNFSKFFLGQQ